MIPIIHEKTGDGGKRYIRVQYAICTARLVDYDTLYLQKKKTFWHLPI